MSEEFENPTTSVYVPEVKDNEQQQSSKPIEQVFSDLFAGLEDINEKRFGFLKDFEKNWSALGISTLDKNGPYLTAPSPEESEALFELFCGRGGPSMGSLLQELTTPFLRGGELPLARFQTPPMVIKVFFKSYKAIITDDDFFV